jgi:tRNA isopentenyl-2-thiomethyl-A-37 hydroxylase MiaE
MKAGEVKMKVAKTAVRMIDTYFSGSSMGEKLANSTLKIIVKQNLYRLDTILNLFADQNGEINTVEIAREYANMIDEQGFTFDIKKYVDNDMIKGLLPNRVLIIKRDDILSMFD